MIILIVMKTIFNDYALLRYLSKNKHVRHIQHYVATCSIGDWFVLYQMSKNLNRPFFMDFLTQLSVRYSLRWVITISDIISDLASLFRPDVEDSDSDTGDNLMTMLLKPSYTAQVGN